MVWHRIVLYSLPRDTNYWQTSLWKVWHWSFHIWIYIEMISLYMMGVHYQSKILEGYSYNDSFMLTKMLKGCNKVKKTKWVLANIALSWPGWIEQWISFWPVIFSHIYSKLCLYDFIWSTQNRLVHHSFGTLSRSWNHHKRCIRWTV